MKSLEPEQKNVNPASARVEDSLKAAMQERTDDAWQMLNGELALKLAENSTDNRAVQKALKELSIAIVH